MTFTDRSTPLSRHLRMIASGLDDTHAAESITTAADILEAAGAVPQRPADALRLLADLFSESVHQTWTRGEIVNVIEDAIRLGSSTRPDSNSPVSALSVPDVSTPARRPRG